MNTRIFALVGAVLLGAVSETKGQDRTFELKLSHFLPPSHPLQKAMEDWSASIEEASKGTIRFQLYVAQQLGKAFDHYDMVRDGIADVTLVVPGYQAGRFPIIAAGELPFMISAAKGGSQALDTWYRTYAANEMRDVRFCLGFVHYPGAFHANKRIAVPADLKGLKIRPGNATVASLVSLLGGVNVQASAPEVRDLLEKGVAEAVTFPPGTATFFGVERILKFHMDAPLYTTAFAFTFNKAKYEAMSTALQTVIDSHCTSDWAERIAGPFDEFERRGNAKLRMEPGHDTYELTPDQLTLWKQAAEPLQIRWAESVRKVGIDPATVMKELKAQLAKNNAS